ncbi:endolytic transglycosylase MltG [Nocardiopsis sp. HNM0947]|uniref:Endolytic murein transglycosylase n=1 Tax=Nocardiopsis coralli TaxID=2772213 RepID=A0ABR9PEG2_9ACTN|nr:endolytic transglycosylase MltG [Nocardiopsis coralli]MBE3002235.1 endolytic transglycosylase MltG [Nocardiopsis coralli]
MTDRDDYPNDPFRGRTERGYDYDPLSDPLPAQPPPRGRRARPEPGSWHEPEPWSPQPMTGADPQEPPRGRRHRSDAPHPNGEPPRRSGAADALRGGRAARTGERPEEQHPADPAQDALAALAGLGGPSAQAPGADESVQGSSPWAGTPSEPFPAEEADPRPRRGRRRRGAPDTDPQGFEEQPAGRRSRRRRARRADRDEGGFLSEVPDETDVFDSGSFPGVDASADSGVFSRVKEDEEPEEPPRRRGGGRRRRRGEDSGAMPAQDPADSGAHDSGALYAGAFAATEPEPEAEPEPEEEPRPRRRGGRRARRAARQEAEQEAALAAEPADEDEPEEEPRSRRRGRTRRSRRKQAAAEPEPVEESTGAEPEPEPEDEDDEDYEPGLADIAEAYGGSRSSRRKLKEAKRRAQNKGKKTKARRGGGRRKSRMGVMAVVLLLVIAGGGFGVVRTYVFPADYEGEGSGEVDFVIEEGDSGTAVAQKLADENVVASVRSFTNALDAVPDQELSPGTYRLAEEMSGEHAVEALLDPDNRLGGRVSIPEGLRATQVIQSVAEQTAISEDELQEAYGQAEELNLPDYATEGPEGYLFPSTYRFEPDAEALSVLKTMVTQYRQVAEEVDLEERAGDTQYDPNEIMAIASIVQAESGTVDDMPKISRVVHNRLDIDMPLQMDSTCFYAIDDYGIALNNDQLAECEADDSGFDTYYSTGLIPGPFVAPGEDAIEAALEPEQGDWLYFVATDPENGVTEFTDDHDEFEVLKERFQENWGGE